VVSQGQWPTTIVIAEIAVRGGRGWKPGLDIPDAIP